MPIRVDERQVEEWRPVVGYEGWYDVSNLGRVRRAKPGPRTYAGRKLKGSQNQYGYIRVSLCKDGRKVYRSIHQLVVMAFLGPYPDGKQVNHIDGDKTNNRIDNLEYVTSSENSLHSFALGLQAPLRGEQNAQSKLTEDNVHEIRQLLGKESKAAIARHFDVSRATIRQIAYGNNWAWLEEENDAS